MLPRHPYSPAIAPSKFPLVGPLTDGLLGHHYYERAETLQNALPQWLQKKESNFNWVEGRLLINTKATFKNSKPSAMV
jgi:hypothetical protein